MINTNVLNFFNVTVNKEEFQQVKKGLIIVTIYNKCDK